MPRSETGHPALFATPLGDGAVRCELCPHYCRLAPGEAGRCRVRRNEQGTLIATTYGVCATVSLDPVEKKPLYHFHPGGHILSVGTWGCNLRCRFCQNYSLSQTAGRGSYLAPQDLLSVAARERGSIGVSFTYNEPLIWYEYVLDCSRLLGAHGQKVALVTNGYVNLAPLEELLPYVDAANVDLKSLDDSFYRSLCEARLHPVLASLKHFHRATHLEVTKLLVMGHGDPVEDANLIAEWIARELSPDVPLHLSRYFPRYEWREPETPMSVLMEAHAAARTHLHYVFVGNAWVPGASDTYCPACGTVLIRRGGHYGAAVAHLGPGGTCGVCGRSVPVVGV